MNELHHALRLVHIAAGALGLALFWLPVLSPKGGPLHVRLGKAFVACAYLVGVTALLSCLGMLIAPLALVEVSDQVTPAAQVQIAARVRGIGAFLGMIALATLATTRHGVLAIRLRRDASALRAPGHLALSAAALLAGLALLGFGIATRSLLFAAVSPIGILTGWGNLGVAIRPPAQRMLWWYQHMEAMLGAGIAFHTAFLVFGISRLIGSAFEGPLALVPWLLPSAIGVPATSLWIRRYRRRFAEAPGRAEAA